MIPTEHVLEMKNIRKEFPGVVALKDVDLNLLHGEVHALCGENGAGKSTLMKILSGAQSATSGEMYVEGELVNFSNTKEAENNGIAMIYQEFNLIRELSVAENVYLGRLPKKGITVDWRKLYSDVDILLKRLNLNINPHTLVSELSVAEAQMIEIAKTLTMGAKVLIMDEPTAALSDDEAKTLFSIIEDLKSQNITVVYISHRMDEIFQISDRITVLRNGTYIATKNIEDTSYDDVVSLMIGRSVEDLYPERNYVRQEKIFEVKNLSGDSVNNISFSLYKGEILGIVGLLGSGNFELTKLMYGSKKIDSGEIYLKENLVVINSPSDALENGIGLITEDRKNDGLVLGRNVQENISLASLKNISNNKVINKNIETTIVNEQVKRLNIKVFDPNKQIVGNLSGGNQQKVLFAKVLETDPTVCIMNEPTRGVDVGAKAEIYSLIDTLTENDKSIILVSSEIEEVIGLSDRIIVMKDGKIVLERLANETNQEEILAYASGGVMNE